MGVRGPGVFFILPCIDTFYCIDLRTVSFNVPPQEVLTKDSVTVTVDAVVYYRISDPMKAVLQVITTLSYYRMTSNIFNQFLFSMHLAGGKLQRVNEIVGGNLLA